MQTANELRHVLGHREQRVTNLGLPVHIGSLESLIEAILGLLRKEGAAAKGERQLPISQTDCHQPKEQEAAEGQTPLSCKTPFWLQPLVNLLPINIQKAAGKSKPSREVRAQTTLTQRLQS